MKLIQNFLWINAVLAISVLCGLKGCDQKVLNNDQEDDQEKVIVKKWTIPRNSSGQLEGESHSAETPLSIQPDYDKWIKIKEGLREEEVIVILGNPIEKDPSYDELPKKSRTSNRKGYLYSWKYGYLRFPKPMFSDDYEFLILFCDGKVDDKYDPFGGDFSSNPKPSIPHLIYPKNKEIFEHYPRFVDFRWTPSSGKYPVHYIIQFGWHESSKNIWYDGTIITTDAPYCGYSWIGSNKGRWRVRAKNKFGESEWTEYRYFKFNI